MAARAKGMRIAELSDRSGTSKETIHFYLREGLLRRPKKTSRNMAYYDDAHLEQLRLIKKLRTESYLPLSVIKDVLKKGKLARSARKLDLTGELLGRGARVTFEPLGRKELSAKTGLSEKRITAYEEEGLLRPGKVGRSKRYGFEDFRVAELFKQAEDEAGPGSEDLVLERFVIIEKHMRRLVNAEVGHFFARIVSTGDPKRALETLQGGRETVGKFLALSRARRLLEEVEAMMPAMEAAVKSEEAKQLHTTPSPKCLKAAGEPARRAELFADWESSPGRYEAAEALLRHLVGVGDHDAALEAYEGFNQRLKKRTELMMLVAEAQLYAEQFEESFQSIDRARAGLKSKNAWVEAFWGSLCLIRLRTNFDALNSSTELIGYLSRAFGAFENCRTLDPGSPVEAARLDWLLGRINVSIPDFLGTKEKGRQDLLRCLDRVEKLRAKKSASHGILEFIEANAMYSLIDVAEGQEKKKAEARLKVLTR